MPRQRILLVDDHEVVRLGLKALIDRQSDVELVAEANGAEGAAKMKAGPRDSPPGSFQYVIARRGRFVRRDRVSRASLG